ncbi:hypothetical protein A8B76_13325 [Roseovarius indicus]|nr:hypothetical protein A8B76_13325 [Roseovarius indicus]
MSSSVDACCAARHYSEVAINKFLCEPSSSTHAFLRRFATSDNRKAAHFAQLPRTLIIKQFNRVLSVSQLFGVIARLVYSNTELAYARCAQFLDNPLCSSIGF